jgi:transposase InsO family protein
MESFNGYFKTEGHSLFLEAHSLDKLITVVDDMMRYYNTVRRHSAIGYISPLTYIRRTLSHLNAQS